VQATNQLGSSSSDKVLYSIRDRKHYRNQQCHAIVAKIGLSHSRAKQIARHVLQ